MFSHFSEQGGVKKRQGNDGVRDHPESSAGILSALSKAVIKP